MFQTNKRFYEWIGKDGNFWKEKMKKDYTFLLDFKPREQSYRIFYLEMGYYSTTIKEKYGIPLSNIVYMGMGEPLLNYSNVMESINRITSPDGLNMSPQRITVSTAGIAKMIKRLGDDEVRFNLALSLHAANDANKELHGCIAPVSILAAEGKGTQSRNALAKINAIVFPVLNQMKQVFLTIKS